MSCGSSGKSALVYLASQGSLPGTILAYKLNLSKGTLSSSNGALTATGKSVNTGTQPTALIFDPTNTFAFVADFGSPLDPGTDNTVKTGDVMAFSIAKDGTLASIAATVPMPPSPTDNNCFSSNPVALATDKDGKFLFVAVQTFFNVNGTAACPGNQPNGTPGPGYVTAYPLSGGTLGTPVAAAIPVPPGPPGTNIPQPTAVAVANGLNYVYVTDGVNNTVVGFAFDSTSGALSSVPGQFLTVGKTPRAVLSPPEGTFLYVANSGSDDIYEFFINADGSLMPITNGTTIVPAGVGPIALLSDPSAKYLLALANTGSQVNVYTINRVTGALGAIGSNGGQVSTGANPVAFTLRSDGSTSGNFWLFTSDFGANSISSYALNGANGALTALPQLTGPVAPFGIASR
ncbi:MAG TPA: beta-propeller fold lactonase family protein [Terriglobales bacterium]|nr:beta-propeller fold lactonase family protein [Terriglobales bacterium]